MTGDLPVDAAGERVSQLLRHRVGLRPDASVRARLLRSVRDDAASRGQELGSYVDSLHVDGQALQSLLNRVTVQETAFFRHPEHFEVLARDLLPTLGPTVTIWSAGCANGQEAFSLAMLLEEQGIDGSVIATDLSTTALLRTTQARYSTREITGLSPERVTRHLVPCADGWQVNAAIRARVSTLHHNLIDPVPTQVSACQIVFCRNVLIYFSAEHAAAFLGRIADALPDVSLFLGAAESIWQLTDRFETVPAADTFSYRPRSQAANPQQHRSAAKPPKPSPAVPGPADRPRRAAPRRELPTAQPEPAAPPTLGATEEVAQAGQLASAAGEHQSAVTAFRKCAYLAPHDPIAHLHLALALETVGEGALARRAFAAARHALLNADPSQVEHAAGGYTVADLHRLLDAKQESEAQ